MSLSSKDRDKIPKKDFGVPGKNKYPLDTEAHIKSAAHLINHGHITSDEKEALARKILRKANEKNMNTSGWNAVKKIAEQVPPMSDGTSLGNAPPRMMAPYYDEQDELLQRANSLDPNSKETMFDKAKRIVTMIHNKTEQDSKPPTGNQNCQLCTWCAEAQFRGMNVLPRPVYSPRDPALAVKGENIVLRPIRRFFTSQRDVVETVRGAVDSRWYVHVNWAESTGGHEFLVVNLNDYAYIMDAQAGLLKEIDELDSSHNYFRDINFRNSYMVRLDDKEFNRKLFNEMNDPSKIMPWKNSLDIPYMRDNGMLVPGADDDPRFRRVPVPSEEGTKYMKQDPELSQYWEELNKATTGEFLIDRETGEPIGHVFVHTNEKDKGFIFNLEVNPKYRRQGYGWILTDDAVRRLGGEDLTVDADNTPAVNLYLQYGFTIYKKGQWHYDPPKDELWMKYDRSKLKQESFMDEYAKRVNDKGDPVPEKCKCGGKVSAYLRGEPVYLCEKCGKYYGTLPCNIQEGAFQDLKNGVNPYSDNMVFHVTPDKHVDGQIWKPRVPDYLDPYNPEDTGFEDNTTPRICFSTSIEGCLNGITVNLQRQSPDTFDKMYVYVPEKPWKEYKHKTNKQLVKDKLVYDANVTREVWIMEPVRMKLYGVIRVDQIADAKRKSVVPTSKGQKDTRNYFTYKWHWVVKPKVLKKATKFDYSPERVIDDLCIDVKKFKYGLIKDGKLQTGNVSDADYNKYWVFHSGETVDQAGGGNCYDMVEYEAGYLEAFGVAYKKYFMNFTNTKNTKTVNTHTICVVPHNGKFIYIEQAFKRIVDEWGYERKKVFDKLNDIFEYVAEVTAEYENQDLNYGVWDYTNAEIDYGTPIKNFQEWIFNNCTMIHDGEATKSKPIKEGYELTAEESDIFIELGNTMFYVSEYHNALFDDPDAHEEAIREFGILLDSYDDIIQEVASYGPYDEYLKKHGYDPKSNTIEDPNRPGKRVSAGRIGSEKERRRMNKLLQDNDYDPKTETILTDIDDKNGGKQRVKLKIDAHRPALAGRKDADGDRYINMPPKELQHKPVSSNNILKHEEGHINQYNNNDTPKSEVDIKRMNAAKDYVSNLDRDKIKADHDLKPTEYDADAYAAQHNKYDKKGLATMNSLAASSTNHERTVSKFEKTIDAEARKQGIRQDSPEYQNKQNIDFLLKHQDHPGGDANDLDWAEYLKKTHNNPEMFDKYLKFEEKKQQLDDLKKKRRTELREIAAKYGSESDEYFDAADKWTAERKSYERELEKIAASPEFTKAEDMIEDLSDMSQLSPDQLKIRDQKETEKAFEFNKNLLRHKTNYRDPEEMKYAHQKRGEFAQQQWNEKNKEQQATEAKQRQLSKEQLQQQLASGKLTGDQAAKAERKIQRIEAFEKQQLQNQPIPKTKPVKPQTTNTTPSPTSTSSSDKSLSVQNQSLTTPPKQEQKPTVKKEGYILNRFKSRFFQEEEEVLSDTEDMEDITIGDLNLDEETTASDDKLDPDDFDENGKAYDDENGYDSDDDSENMEDQMEVPGYLKDRMSEEDVTAYEQPDEKLDADNVDLGQFGKDQSDVQNDYDQKEIDILMKLMASEADAMNEYMDGAKETNVDVLRRLYADIANEERFHMEQLLFAKSELTGEKYQPKDPEVKSEYEELLKMGMDEETAMQTAVDRCHIRGSISNDDGERTIEIQQDVETMEMAINMFNAQFDNIMMMMESDQFKREDLNHAIDVFTEACYVQEEVYNTKMDNKSGGYLNQNKKSGPVDLLKRAIGFLLRLLGQLISKFGEFLRRTRNRSNAIRNYVKRYGASALFASSKETLKMYFVDIDAPACINDATETFLSLVSDTFNATTRMIGSNFSLDTSRYNRDPRFNIGGNVEKGIQILSGVQLVKTKMLIPQDESKQEAIAACLFGYNFNQKAQDGSSYNTLNRLKVYTDKWSVVMNAVSKQLDVMNTLHTQQGSIYYRNRKKYDLAIKSFETIIKTCKAVVTALQSDINALMKLNNEAENISIKKTEEKDQNDMNAYPELKQMNDQYKQSVDKGMKK